MGERFSEIDIVKGIAMILVMFEHSVIDYPIDLHEHIWCANIRISLKSFFMPVFFVVSGFLFATSSKPWQKVVLDKVRRLLVPWFFITIITQIAKIISPTMAMNVIDDWSYLLKYAFINAGDRWFIYILFLVFMYSLMIKPIINDIRYKVFFIFILTLALILFKLQNIQPLGRALYFLVFFLVGEVAREYYNWLKTILSRYWVLFLSFFFSLNIVSVVYLENYNFVYKYILPLSGSCGIFTLSLIIDKYKQIKMLSFLRYGISYIGKYTLQYYLLAAFVLAPLRYFLVVKLDWNAPIPIILVCFFGQIVIMLFAIEIIKRIPYVKFLFGF